MSTASKSGSTSKQQTAQTGISRFLIGEELGRGAYGQVYKGIDTSTGDVVAIKQISLAGVSQENLAGVMGEIDLLKTLNHKNIVKYIGSFKTRSHLYIILEYMENGALSSVIKPNRFGVFPETLVAIYIAQVLQGLAYLHDQGVVHRDIKGANILTTKDGLVKLADFGVAAKLGELEEQHNDELHQNVVGTPYWMAPEVIEMTQVTPASDIWSVGCLIIELLTGYPPYYDLQPMSALFRIVQDGHPPLPETVSPLLEDFLLKCFQKDPSARPDARSLLQHEWVQFNRRTLRGTWNTAQGFKTRGLGSKASDAHETVNSVVARILQAEFSEDDLSRSSVEAQQRDHSAAAAAGRGQVQQQQQAAAVRTIDAAAGPLASNTPARLALQQDTLLTASSNVGTIGSSSGPGMAAGAAAGINLLNAPTLPSPLPAAGAAAQPSAADVVGSQQQQQRRLGSIELAATANGSGSPLGLPRGNNRLTQQQLQQQQRQQPYMQDQQQYVQQQQQQLQQVGLQQQQPQPQQQQQDYQSLGGEIGSTSGGRPPPLTFVGQQLQYGPASSSNQAGTAAGGGAVTPPAASAAAGGSTRFSPTRGAAASSAAADVESPLSNLLARMQGDPGTAALGTASAAGGAAPGAHTLLGWLEDGPAQPGGSPGGLRDMLSGPSRGQALDGGLFGGSGAAASYLLPASSPNSLDSSTHSSQLGLDVAESSFLMESKRKVRDLVRSLRPGVRESNMTPQQAAASLASMFTRLAESRQHFLSEGGVLAALELLESDQARLAEAALDLLTAFTAADARLLESLCLVGLVPVVARMAAGTLQQQWQSLQSLQSSYAAGAAASSGGVAGSREAGSSAGAPPGSMGGATGSITGGLGAFGPGPAGSSAELSRLRTKAAVFVSQLCFTKDTTLQMFIACGGLRCLVAMVQDNVSDPATLTPAAVSCIYRVLDTYGALPINYICRIFAHAGLVQRLYAVVKQLIAWQRQQQQRGSYGSSGAASGPVALKFHHLHSPSSPSVFGPVYLPGIVALEGLSVLGPDNQAGEAGGQASARKVPAGREGLAGLDELQHHRRARSVDENAAAAAAAAGIGGKSSLADWLLEKSLDLLLVLAHADSVVKGIMCNKDNLQQLLDLTQRLQPPGLLKVMRTMRWLTSEPSVLPAVKDSGAISQLVPFLSREREAASGQAVVLEALQALYNICKFNRRVHLEVAATGGIVPHLCRFASELVSSFQPPPSTPVAAATAASTAGAASSSLSPAVGDPLADPAVLSAAASHDARRTAVRAYVLPLLCGMVSTSSSTRAKLWASNGLDIFLQLLGTEEPQMQVGLMRTLDIWLAEDHSRVETRLCQREAVGQLVEVYARLCRNSTNARSPVMPQMLDSLKVILGRSSKVAVSLATGGLVPALLEPLSAGLGGMSGSGAAGSAGGSSSAPILRAKLLEIVRIMYQHYPRPKEFIIKYRIQDVLLRLLEAEGRGEDAVKVEAQKLLNAFHINVLL